MNKYKILKNSRLLLFGTVVLTLTACATPPAQPDIFKIEKQAAKAYQEKNWALAEEKYSYLISQSPNVAEIWFRLGNIYAHTKKPEKAITAYREAVIRQPEYSKAWHNLGIISLRQTTALYLEMLKNIKDSSPLYAHAKKTADALIKILEQRREKSKTATEVKPDMQSLPESKKE